MERRANWYFKGWTQRSELVPTGKKKTVWVYNGEYYTFVQDSRSLVKLKALYVGCTAAGLVLWLMLSLMMTAGKDAAAYVGLPWYLSFLPMMELIAGAGCVLVVKPQMTYRAMYGSYKRLQYGIRIQLPMQVLAVVGDIVYLALYHGQTVLSKELLWLAGAVVCVLLDALVAATVYRLPPVTLEDSQKQAKRK